MNACGETASWREPVPTTRGQMGYGETWRTCGYCGSIHPDDLAAMIVTQGLAPALTDADYSRALTGEGPLHRARGVYLTEADWKYGWPHKLYVDGLPSAMAGQRIEVGGTYRGGKKLETHYGVQGETTGAKFYTKHLGDASDFEALAAAIHEAIPNQTWTRDERGIKWRGHPGRGVY